MVSEEERKEIKLYLEKGDLKNICKHFSKHSIYPSKVFRGQVKNLRFLAAIREKVETNKKLSKPVNQ